ncbi:MAG: tetratricopeptide repeat protein [Pirellulales bacterium]
MSSGDSLKQADADAKLGRLHQAEATLRRLLERDPMNIELHKRLAGVLFRTSRPREVEKFLEQSLEKFPADDWILIILLRAEFRPLPPRDALVDLEPLNKRQPGQVAVVRALAWCYWQTGEMEQARKTFLEALELDPANPETRLAAASFLFELGELERADQLLMADATGNTTGDCPALFDDDDRWWSLRGKLAQARADPKAALFCFERALRRRPRDREYLQYQATLLKTVGRQREAARAFRAVSRIERCRWQLLELVLNGQVERPTPSLCLELAELCEIRGRGRQAEGWRLLYKRFEGAGAAGRVVGAGRWRHWTTGVRGAES